MPITLTTHAKEESTYIVTASFFDEEGNAVVPNSISWTLLDPVTAATIRTDTETPAETVDILLSGTDLAFLSGETNQAIRELKVEAVYDSALASNLPLRNSVRLLIDEIDH